MSDVQSFIRFSETEFGTTIMDREAAYIKQYVAADDRILNVGCGIGSLEERFPEYQIIGLDRSEEMVQAARGRVAAPIILGDATALPIATASVDTIVFVSTLEFISDIDSALAEATRVLTSEGTIVTLVLNTRSEYVQSNLQREGSYFQRMIHRDSETLAKTILHQIDGEQEFFLGISDKEVFESSEPTTAAISSIVGTPTG